MEVTGYVIWALLGFASAIFIIYLAIKTENLRWRQSGWDNCGEIFTVAFLIITGLIFGPLILFLAKNYKKGAF